MLLKTLSYQDKRTGWTLQDLELDRFNLLVGASGVGKTRILRAIREVRATAYGRGEATFQSIGTHADVAISFTVGFEHEGDDYIWEFESSPASRQEGASRPPHPAPSLKTLVTREKLTSTRKGVLFERGEDSLVFRGKALPQLNRAETALVLLAEPTVQEVRDAFTNLLDDRRTAISAFIPPVPPGYGLAHLGSLEDLRSYLTTEPAVMKAFFLQEQFASDFARLKQLFIDIFPSVEDIAVKRTLSMGEKERELHLQLDFELKEHDVPVWIPVEEFSSGMLRTLTHLIDIWLAPAGTVILIDEFENSLGVNCMGPLTEFIQSRASELQFIITSHHPYIINKIPKSHWKVVRRKGSVVRVTPASEIRALQGASAQDDFTRLLNSPEFEEGLA
jgi:predicted ATPase